jgi:uncharacterized caspase-like protein
MSCRIVSLALAVCCLLGVPLTGSGEEKEKAKGKKVALLVGVTEYDSDKLATLKYTENDVEELAKVLTAKGAGFDEVVVLTNTRGKKDDKLSPTAANVREALKRLSEKRAKEDLILVAFAGHGGQITVKDPDGLRKPKTYTYLFPRDAQVRGVSYATGKSKELLLVRDLLATAGQSKAGTKLLLFDAGREQIGRGGDGEKERFDLEEGMAVLFSCAAGQKAFETPKLKHGVFFYHVIKGLSGEAKNKRGEVDWVGLTSYVSENVSETIEALIGNGAKQTPQLVANVTGSPVLIPKP